MTHESILVEVWIPAAHLHKDMYLPYDLPVQLIIELMKQLLEELRICEYRITAQTRLYRMETMEELSLQKSCRDYQMRNAEICILL